MKFLIVNAFHRDDKGDAALLHVLMDQLLSIDPKADIVISSFEDPKKYPTFRAGRNIGSFELYSSSQINGPMIHFISKIYTYCVLLLVGGSGGKFSWLLSKNLKRIYDECKSADLVVSIGGGYFITKKSIGSRLHLLFALQAVTFPRRLGRPVVTAPVSVGPFRNSIEEHYTSKTLQRLNLVLLREDISKQYFIDKDGNLPVNVRRAPDSAFAFTPSGSFNLKKLINLDDGEQILALAVRSWMDEREQAKYEQAHADLIDYIARKYPKIRPVFIPQCTFKHAEEDDRIIARNIIERSKTKKAVIINEDLDYQKVKLSYKSAEYIVGTRFHAMVFGLAYEVPGIAIEYEHKTRGIMRDLGLERWVIHITAITSGDLINLFDRMVKEKNNYKLHLKEVVPPYVAKTNEVTILFKRAIK